MLFKNTPERFWNLIASKYAASPIADRPAYENKIRKLKTFLTPDMSVLDIGCATGTQCGDIADSVQHVIGIDISSKLLTIARQRMADRKAANVEFIQTSAFDERFQPGSLDAVMAFHVLHFFEDIDLILKRINELLKPGGIFISETACLGDRNKLMGNILRALGHLGLLPRINLLTTRRLEDSLKSAGFSIILKSRFSHRPDAEFTYVATKV